MVMLLLSFICDIAGSATTYAQSFYWQVKELQGRELVPPKVRSEGITGLVGDVIVKATATNDSNGNIVLAEATLDARVYSCSPTIFLPTVTRVEISQPPSATNPNVV